MARAGVLTYTESQALSISDFANLYRIESEFVGREIEAMKKSSPSPSPSPSSQQDYPGGPS